MSENNEKLEFLVKQEGKNSMALFAINLCETYIDESKEGIRYDKGTSIYHFENEEAAKKFINVDEIDYSDKRFSKEKLIVIKTICGRTYEEDRARMAALIKKEYE